MGALWIEDGERMLFIGDSITDCGRRGVEAPLGNGYVRIFTELATARWPERKIPYINKGIGGNRITDLKERWADDVLYHRPDVLSLKIGINDLHSHLRGAEGGVSPELFARIYAEVMELTKRELGCKIVLLTPFYISTDRSGQTFRSQVLDLIPRYIETVEKMSAQYNTRLVHLHEIFQQHLKYRDADTFCPEPVHPNLAGHTVIAQALMDTLTDAP
ncbi:MAG: SGNH/GDSL hydrolase family protein [Candidatus Handelsmanbacteria bacterium]|nr:SGNH/GDSL hydrolase family protein [Candidatus Handelsmanbacteria bacterium]